MSHPTTPPPTTPHPKSNEAMTANAQDTMPEQEKQTHLSLMREALAMAEQALHSNETPVGCVFVHNGAVIGRGMNATNRSYNGTRHAEFMAISSILSELAVPASDLDGLGEGRAGEGEGVFWRGGRERRYPVEILRECDLYVTVEPCIMCASLLRQFGVRRVFFGASNEKFGGTGGVLSLHRGNGRRVCEESELEGVGGPGEEGEGKAPEREDGDYEVSGGWLRDSAVHLLQRFYMQENERAPDPKARGKKGAVLDEVDVEVLRGNEGNG